MTNPTLITTATFTEPNNLEAYNYAMQQNELTPEFHWYDYGARFYDASLGRFHSVDPLAEDYYFQSSFLYGANNPIRFIDYMGMSAEEPPSWLGSFFRLISGSSGDIDAPEEVEIPDQTRQVTEAVATVNDAADVVDGVGEVLVESVPSGLQDAGTALEVASYAAAIPTGGASLVMLPAARTINLIGVGLEVAKDVIDGNLTEAGTKIAVSFSFGKITKSIDKVALKDHWDVVSQYTLNLVNDAATHIGSFIRNETTKKVKKKKSK